MNLYAKPAIYDILHAPGSAEELRSLARIARRHAVPHWSGLSCAEPACGSGRLLRLLAKRGARVFGIDQSPEMLAYARDRMPTGWRGKLIEGDMAAENSAIPDSSIHFAFNLINSIRHLMDDATLLAHLAEVARQLRPDGLYVVGLSLSEYGAEEISEDRWSGSRGRCRVDQLVQYMPAPGNRGSARFETVISHLRVRRPRGEEHFDDRYELRGYDQAQWRRVIARSALEILEICDDQGVEWAEPAGLYRLYVLGPSSSDGAA